MKNKKLLVDADIMVFQYACVNQVKFEWEEDITSEVITPEDAIEGMELFISALKVATETDEQDPLFCFSDSTNFRYEVLPTYKHNRKGKERPKLLPFLRKHIENNYETKCKPNMEADDVLGILGSLKPDECIIASIDKDLKQIPCWHYNWRQGQLDFVTPEEADYFFYQQILTGDPTDGYKGCPRVGEKTAEKLLKGVDWTEGEKAEKEAWQVVVEAYVSKGLTEADALQQARVARILTKYEYDFKKKELILWNPPLTVTEEC